MKARTQAMMYGGRYKAAKRTPDAEPLEEWRYRYIHGRTRAEARSDREDVQRRVVEDRQRAQDAWREQQQENGW